MRRNKRRSTRCNGCPSPPDSGSIGPSREGSLALTATASASPGNTVQALGRSLSPSDTRAAAILVIDDDREASFKLIRAELVMVTALVIPSLGSRHLVHCLDAVSALDPRPERTVVVFSGPVSPPVVPSGVELVTSGTRLGFAAAVNAGIASIGSDCDLTALLNDDAVPSKGWLGVLENAFDEDQELAAVQGTVTDPVGAATDGRGIALDRYGLPVQIDRGLSPAPEPSARRAVLAVSATAAVFRSTALRDAALRKTLVFDPSFGSYHEDLDLGLRLRRLGWRAAWVPGAWAHHVGSASGLRLGWRHPWWLLSNRWRALAGNLTGAALLSALPVLLRGELRAVHSLVRVNPRAFPVSAAVLACLPRIVNRSLGRPSPGPRLTALPEAA